MPLKHVRCVGDGGGGGGGGGDVASIARFLTSDEYGDVQ